MRQATLRGWIAAAIAASVIGFSASRAEAQLVTENFIVPGGSTFLNVDPLPDPLVTIDWPIVDWTRGDTNTTYAEWDTFGSCGIFCSGDTPPPDIEPDVGSSGFIEPDEALANVLSPTAFYTSTGNVYSFSEPTDWEITMPAPDGPAGSTYYFVAQTNTVGNVLDLGDETELSSVVLSFDGGNQLLQATGVIETQNVESGSSMGGSGVSTLFWWEIVGESPETFLLEFNAAGTSMSLTNLALDVFAGPTAALVGDYDASTSVDQLDYELWAYEFGSPGPAADGNADAMVSAADYAVWRDSIDAIAASAIVSSSVATPEPAGSVAVAFASAGFGLRRPRRRRPLIPVSTNRFV